MSQLDMIFIAGVVCGFCALGATLAWATHRTKDLHKP